MKILFITTPSIETEVVSLKEKSITLVSQPLGVCYLGTILCNSGFDVEVYEPHIAEYGTTVENIRKGIRKKLSETEYDMLCISAMFIYTYEWAHYLADISKQEHPDKSVIMGGGYPSLMPEGVLKDTNVDYVILGEGEKVFLSLLNGEDVSQLDGIGYRDKGEIVIVHKKSYIENVDSIPYPAWNLVDTEKYFKILGKRALNIITTRGCPYRCTFCSTFKQWGRKFRERSVENILGEVDYLIDNFNIDEVTFIDDNITIDKPRFMKIASGLKKRQLKWCVHNIASFTTDEEMLLAMKEGGCDTISIALESANKNTLKQLRKPVDLDKTRVLVNLCRKLDLHCNLIIIAGLPYDTKETINETVRYVKDVGPDWCTISTLMPFPGTEIYDYCKKHNYFINNDTCLSMFTFRNKGFIETENWTRDWMIQKTHEANIQINFLRNYNIHHDDGDIDYAIKMFSHVFKFHPRHVISCMCLAYAFGKKGETKKPEEYVKKAHLLLESEDVKKDYGRFMALKDEPVVSYYYSQLTKINV